MGKVYAPPGSPGSVVTVKPRYDNFIGGKWVAPVNGQYMPNVSPVTGKVFCEVAKSTADDVELALDAAHAAKDAWGDASLAERAAVLNAIADALEANLEMLAVAETWENGKPVRETLAADIPLAIDHFRYFAGATRSLEGRTTEIDKDTVAYHFHEPLGVVGQIIPFNFPLLMAAWKMAPALAAGNCTVLKPASPTPWSILKLAEVVADVVPAGVINIITGPGGEIGKALATSPRIAKIGFTGETTTGRLIMQYAAQNLIPSTTELGGKSPNVFFADIMDEDDSFLDKAVEGLVLYAFNKGEVCTCPSRALIQESIYDKFMARCLERIGKIVQGNPLDTATMMGPQVSTQQLEKIGSYVDIGLQEGAECLIGGHRSVQAGDLADGLLLRAHGAQGRQQDAGLPGGDLRAGAGRDHLQRRGRRRAHRQRHPLRPGRRRVDPQRQPGLPHGPGHQGRPRVDQLLPPLPRRRSLRRLQDLGRRAGEPPDDARALHADQEPAGQLQPRAPRVLLIRARERETGTGPDGTTVPEPAVVATPAALEAVARLVAERGPVMFFQSGGCCDGSLPMCFDDGELMSATTTSCWASWAAAPSTSTAASTSCGSTRSSSSMSAKGRPKGSPWRPATDRHFITRSRVCSADEPGTRRPERPEA